MAKKILVAIELAEDSARDVLQKVQTVSTPQDTCDVVYVLDPTVLAYSADPSMMGTMYQSIYETAADHARERLVAVCKPFGISAQHCHIRYGRVAHEVHRLVEEEQYDCLMIGSHGRSGWRRILGSKASSILHGTPVDTWVFKVREET